MSNCMINRYLNSMTVNEMHLLPPSFTATRKERAPCPPVLYWRIKLPRIAHAPMSEHPNKRRSATSLASTSISVARCVQKCAT
eukprot:COSAG02_NODE_148_length_33809_cov_158.369594_9_plen_83_part_00